MEFVSFVPKAEIPLIGGAGPKCARHSFGVNVDCTVTSGGVQIGFVRPVSDVKESALANAPLKEFNNATEWSE